MRVTLLAIAAVLAAAPALAQTSPFGQNPAQTLNNLKPEDAARLNYAVQNNQEARQALDQVEKKLNEHRHPAGQMLEKTRP